MLTSQLSRFKELTCVLFGHSWGDKYERSEIESGRILEQHDTCMHCNLTVIDKTGLINKYEDELNKSSSAPQLNP